MNVDSNPKADEHWDIRKLPVQDGYAERIAAIHVFEHFYLWETQDLLAEWKRVLKPGGKLILELPCMDKVLGHIGARLRKGKEPSPTFSWLALWGDPTYKDPAMSHRWGYFKADMVKVLGDAGFTDIQDETPRYHFERRDMRFTARKP